MDGFLFIEPKEQPVRCVVDSLTRTITAVMRQAVRGISWMGYHTCICGAKSTACDWSIVLADRRLTTNSLAVHYVACHREEVPSDQLAMLESLQVFAEPTPFELKMPGSKLPSDDYTSLPRYCFKKNVDELPPDSAEWRLNLGLYYLTQALMDRMLGIENVFIELESAKWGQGKENSD
jgi:hypothetical protein